ncbi:hypothetical protein OF83DRAFT_768083 [Amylostereum chailletii]|nr:hypothetical protein OF83DRAFT_768083 [Amylostereum chailletii]
MLQRRYPGVTKERLYTEVKPVSFMHHPFTSNVLSSTMHELTFTFPPTFMKRNHNLVDLSTFLREGANDVTFTQRSNLADYVFVVLAHHPTPRQLELVDAQRSRETRWRSVLDRAAAPLQPPTPSWIEFISRPWPVTEPLPMSG